MEGLLCLWALAIQEFCFETMYRKGTTNGNTDALLCRSGPEIETRHAALTTVHAWLHSREDQASTATGRHNPAAIALRSEQHFPLRNWKQPPLRRYAQLWSELDTVDGIVCRKYQPGPTSDTIVVPLLLETLHQTTLVHLCMFVQTTDSMPICVPSFLYMYRVSKD